MKFEMRCTCIRSDRPTSAPILNDVSDENGACSYAILEGTKLAPTGLVVPAGIALRVPDEVAREMFGGAVTIAVGVGK